MDKQELKEYRSKYYKKWIKENKGYRRKYYESNRDYFLKRQWIYDNTLKGCFSTYKKSAKRRDLDFKITIDYFKKFWKKSCSYCGGEIKSIGLDRIDNNKGYIVGNLCSCCYICNISKRKLSQEDFINLCRKVSKHCK